MKALTTITIPEGRLAIQQFQQKFKDLIMSGDVDPLEVDIKLKAVSDAIEAIRKDQEVRYAVMSEASKYIDKTFEMHGAQITRKLTPARYDYEACGDPAWTSLNNQINELYELRKQREKLLQALTAPQSFLDDQTGEVTLVRPPVKEQGETLSVKFI